MKHFKKVYTHDEVIVASNTDKDKYLNYETSNSGKTIGNICVCCHKSE